MYERTLKPPCVQALENCCNIIYIYCIYIICVPIWPLWESIWLCFLLAFLTDILETSWRQRRVQNWSHGGWATFGEAPIHQVHWDAHWRIPTGRNHWQRWVWMCHLDGKLGEISMAEMKWWQGWLKHVVLYGFMVRMCRVLAGSFATSLIADKFLWWQFLWVLHLDFPWKVYKALDQQAAHIVAIKQVSLGGLQSGDISSSDRIRVLK